MIAMDVQKVLKSGDGMLDLRIQLDIRQGEFVTLYGPSGAGKTSTLRMLAGLMRPDQGSLLVHGKTWFDSGRSAYCPPRERNIGFVFQDYALFPHMTVGENLRFALGKNRPATSIDRLVSLLSLQGLQEQKPATLSGGQQQRVALARALVQQPEILLLDEPLAALDLETRLRIQDHLHELHREFGLTTLLISHDAGEIMKLSDRVFVLENGRITNEGSPEAVFIRKKVSGKFQFTGKVLRIERQEVVYIVTVSVQASVVKVVADEADIRNLRVGDTVLLASKAFNPILYKLS